MRRIHYTLMALMMLLPLLSACTTRKYTVSTDCYVQTVDEVNRQLQQMGLQLVGRSEQSYYDVYLEHSYDDDGQEITETKRGERYLTETFRFLDSSGAETDYTVRYHYQKDKHDMPYIEDLSVADCYCTTPGLYDSVCGRSGAVTRLDYVAPDQTSVIHNKSGTVWTVFSSVVGAIILLLTLPL